MKHAASPSPPFQERGRIYVVSSGEMREIDRRTIDLGTPGDTLMERAGELATVVLRERFRRALRRGVVIVAGKGNNGGDAMVVARHLKRARIDARVHLAARTGDLTGDARTNLGRWKRLGGRVQEIGAARGLAALVEDLGRCGVVVDGLFGTGLRGDLDEGSRSIVTAMNAAPAPILAVDIPSGLDADRGVVLGEAVQASVTVTFGCPKTGLLLYPGAERAGEVVVADIGIAREAFAAVAPKQRLLTEEVLARAVPRRPSDSHKGTFGHLLVLAGAVGKSGAALLCGRAALRAGGGLTTVAAPAPALGGFLGSTPELMTEPLPDDEGGWAFSKSGASRLLALFEGKDAAVFGPGVGTKPMARALTEWLIASCPVPLVLDADGLNCLAGRIDWLAAKRADVVLTPHPGEMARLLSCSTGDVQADRVGVAREFAVRHSVTVVLKGARTVIASRDGVVSVNPTGNPGMASGGMGDALSGVIGSLLAQGLAPGEAAEAGVLWHGLAADRVARRLGSAGLLASDVIEELPLALGEAQASLFDDAPRAS